MTASIQLNPEPLIAGLVLVELVLIWVLPILLGGFKIGKLESRLELLVRHDRLSGFYETFLARLTELGFQSVEEPGHFQQGGAEFGNPGSFTHAKTPKELAIDIREASLDEAKVRLRVRYLETIVGDTGETAYADEVLGYVASQKETFTPVPNRSHLAFCSLVGGIWTWVAMLGLKMLDVEPFVAPVLTLGVTNIATGGIAIVTICFKPVELKGIGLAISGIAVSALALVAMVALRFF